MGVRTFPNAGKTTGIDKIKKGVILGLLDIISLIVGVIVGLPIIIIIIIKSFVEGQVLSAVLESFGVHPIIIVIVGILGIIALVRGVIGVLPI